MTTLLTVAQPCRHCGRPTYGADTTGPVHPCCEKWMAMGWPGYCPACAESRKAARRDPAGVR